MIALVIELKGTVKEAFSYERPLNEGSYQALVEYAQANYGPDATLRHMTSEEKANFLRYGPEFFEQKS